MGSISSILQGPQKDIDMSSAEAQFVQEVLGENKVVIFSKSYCPYCVMAKEQFNKLGVQYHAIELDSRPDCNKIQDVLGAMTGQRSVPRCFIDGKFIGGGTDVKQMYENGSLQEYFS